MWCTMNMITKFSYCLSSEVGARKNIYIVKVERLIFRLKSLKEEMEVGAEAQGLRLDRPGSWGQLIHGGPQGIEGGGSRTMEAGVGKVCRLTVRILGDSLGLKISTLSTPATCSHLPSVRLALLIKYFQNFTLVFPETQNLREECYQLVTNCKRVIRAHIWARSQGQCIPLRSEILLGIFFLQELSRETRGSKLYRKAWWRWIRLKITHDFKAVVCILG